MPRAKTKRPAKKRQPPAVLDRVTQAEAEPGQGGGGDRPELLYSLWQWGLISQYRDDVYVNRYTALTYPVVWRCVNYIAGTIAGLGWHQFESQPGEDDKTRIIDDVSWLLDTAPNEEMNAFEWRQVMLKDALTAKGGYSEIERDGMGRPRNLWRLEPDRVELKRDGGQLYYEIDNGPGSPPNRLRPENVFHIRGLSPDGLVGYSSVQMALDAIKLGLQQQKYGSTYFSRGPMPGGLLKLPGNPKEEERRRAGQTFEKSYGGSKNAGKVIVTSGQVEFTKLDGSTNGDAQLTESRKFQIEEVCRIFGVPPHKVADLDRATFSNIEQEDINAVRDCLLPWSRRLECEANVKLYGRTNRGRRWTQLNLETMLRGDSATQTANLQKQVTSGIVTIDEARNHLGYNRLPGGLGDVPMIQGAMVPLDRAQEPPPPPPPALPQLPAKPSQDGQDSQQQKDQNPQDRVMSPQIEGTFSSLLSDAYGRLLRTEADKAKRAEARGETPVFVKTFYDPAGNAYVADTVRPIVMALLLACGKTADTADRFAERFAADHNRRSVEQIAAGTWQREWANGRPNEQAREHLRQLWEVVTDATSKTA